MVKKQVPLGNRVTWQEGPFPLPCLYTVSLEEFNIHPATLFCNREKKNLQ